MASASFGMFELVVTGLGGESLGGVMELPMKNVILKQSLKIK